MSVTFTDIFCGAGGSSTGLVNAGMELKLAANHWERAIETHSANHPGAEHLCADMDHYDMRRLPDTDVLWASPICTEGSPSGGRKRRSRKSPGIPGQEGIQELGYVPQTGFERTRATAYDILRATEVHRYKVVMYENVPEFATDWELYSWWVQGFRVLGYRHVAVSVNAAHIGGAGNDPAAQWRDRYFGMFVADGLPLPDLAPRPTAWCPVCQTNVAAIQYWKDTPVTRRYGNIGKYRDQYDYRCPNGSRCRHAVVEPYVAPAASIIDWDDRGVLIGERAERKMRPLAATTVARIEAGLAMLGKRRMVVTVNHKGHDGRAFDPGTGPLPTRTGKIGEAVVVPCGGTWNTTPYLTDRPLRTQTGTECEALAIPPDAADAFVVEYRNHATASPVTAPIAAVTAQGNHHGLVIPYRKGLTKTTDEPLLTMATVDPAGLARPAPSVQECHYRMLQPREQLLAQRFPRDYIVHGNRGEQTMQAGNAVPANVAQWLGGKALAVLA
ncbi:DNA cytosine methyltransferase [Catenulispora rubra]|uniref:DNA cytosine methyltransferase n=1 Tax=Catenulispora rubra TaxID=280293 RepID=UPI0018926FF3|nr:DNA cytosine methyltransferase [Catenulispora rubra]